MEFSNIEEMVIFIEKKMNQASKELTNKMVEIAKETTEKEQGKYSNPSSYTRTGDLLRCIKPTSTTKDLMEITWENSGRWKSYKGNPFYAPIALETGKTYGVGGYRPKTNFVELTEKRVENELPKHFKTIMNSLGVPIV